MPFDDSTPLTRPLDGARFAIARIEGRAEALAEALRAEGATVTEISLTRVEFLDPVPLTAALAMPANHDWIVLTSASAVQALHDAATERRLDISSRKLAMLGTATLDAAQLRGWHATIVPARPTPEALLDAMAARSDVEGARVLYPAADASRDVLPSGLRALGAYVETITAYRSSPDLDGQAQLRALAATGTLDLLVVATLGTVDAILEAIPAEHTTRLPLACIGPIASRAARRAGFPVKVEADNATPTYFVRRIVAAFARAR